MENSIFEVTGQVFIDNCLVIDFSIEKDHKYTTNQVLLKVVLV